MNIKRWFNKMFWWDGCAYPKDIITRVRNMDNAQLESLRDFGWDVNQSGGSGTPRGLQIKAIEREIRRRSR